MATTFDQVHTDRISRVVAGPCDTVASVASDCVCIWPLDASSLQPAARFEWSGLCPTDAAWSPATPHLLATAWARANSPRRADVVVNDTRCPLDDHAKFVTCSSNVENVAWLDAHCLVINDGYCSDAKVNGTSLQLVDMRMLRVPGDPVPAGTPAHADQINRLTRCDRTDMVMSCSDDKTVRVWSPSLELQHELTHPARVVDCAWSPDGGSFATVAGDRVARIFQFRELGGARETRLFIGYDTDGRFPARVAWAGDHVATSFSDGTVNVWETNVSRKRTRDALRISPTHSIVESSPITCIDMPCASMLVCGSADCRVRVLRLV